MKPHFPSFDRVSVEDTVDDDDCIICKKLLLKHTEQEASQCYNILIKKRLVKGGGRTRFSKENFFLSPKNQDRQ